tara:strand:+ start:614 stop:1063 length:450 start_codon:yes stop_codon:yes gene_type:complete
MEAKIEGVNIAKQIFSNDNRLNYTFIKKEELEDEQRGTRLPEWLDRDKIDYDVVVKKVEDTDDFTVGMGKLDETLPASYCAIKTLEEGIEWYKHKYPEYPDDFIEILARYQWGEQPKEPPKEVKKKKKKNKKALNKLKVRQGKFKLEFN